MFNNTSKYSRYRGGHSENSSSYHPGCKPHHSSSSILKSSGGRMRLVFTSALLFGLMLSATAAPRETEPDARLKKASRRAEQNGWIYVHLEGAPSDIGFQNGYLLAEEIKLLQKTIALELTHDSGKDYQFFRA